MIWHTIVIVESSTRIDICITYFKVAVVCVPCSSRSVEVMGGLLTNIFGKKDMRILMLGLDAAGKTSIPSQGMNEFTHSIMI